MINIFCLAYLGLTTPSRLVLGVLEVDQVVANFQPHSCSLYLVVFGDEPSKHAADLSKMLAKYETMG